MTDVIYINGVGPYAYEFTEDVQTIQMMSSEGKKPDPNWFVIDDNGHFHAFDVDGENRIPTLKVVAVDNIDYLTESQPTFQHRCLLCEEIVVPHFLPGGVVTTTMEGPRSAGFTIPRYNRSISKDQRVSFYTKNMFGIATVVAFGIETHWDGQAVSATFQCEFYVRRKNDM